jgi:hypothetical protein
MTPTQIHEKSMREGLKILAARRAAFRPATNATKQFDEVIVKARKAVKIAAKQFARAACAAEPVTPPRSASRPSLHTYQQPNGRKYLCTGGLF